LRDLLPPEAETEAAAIETLMEVFASHGYQRVKPPLLEFEDSLLAGSGAAVAEQTFRLMDPDSQRMMGVRADTTPQVARIATTRLASAPRPLRLSYAGQCLRVRGNQLVPARQVAQAGIELIGNDSAAAGADGARPHPREFRPNLASISAIVAGRFWSFQYGTSSVEPRLRS
jgi:ATP phosphoribosyltransferase regulatory subunit